MAKLFFENKYILTKKLYRQYCSKTFVTMYKRNRILAFCLAVGFTIAAVIVFIFTRIKWLTIFLGILAAYFYMMGICGYHFSEWLNYRRMQEEQGDVLVHILKFCSDQVHVQVNQTKYTFKYSSITKAYETEDLFILIIGAKGMIEHGQVVFKNGFAEKNDTTLQSFKEFVNQKAKKPIFDLDGDLENNSSGK